MVVASHSETVGNRSSDDLLTVVGISVVPMPSLSDAVVVTAALNGVVARVQLIRHNRTRHKRGPCTQVNRSSRRGGNKCQCESDELERELQWIVEFKCGGKIRSSTERGN